MPPPLDEVRRALSACTSIDAFLDAWLRHRWLPDPDQRVLEHYYASYVRNFGPRVRRHYRRQTEDVLAILAGRPLRILEVGVGCGTEAIWFALQGARVDGIDIRSDRLEVARLRAAISQEALGVPVPTRFARANLLDHRAEPYDIVWLENTFHHLEPRDEVSRRLSELVAPGGHLVIAEVNALNPAIQLQYFRQRGFRTLDTYVDEDGRRHPYGVERITTLSAVRRRFEALGFETVRTRRFRIFPNRPLFDRLAFFERLAEPVAPSPLTTNYTWVGRKAASR